MEEPGSKDRIYVPDKAVYISGPVSRRLKPFALDIRGVCTKWKNIIDSEENFSLSRYWFARLVLAIPSYSISRQTDQGKKQEYVSFAKQMIQSRSQLSSSRGCDLYVFLLSSGGMEKWSDDMDLYSETGIMVRLMAYALVDLQRYFKQIVGIYLLSDEPHMVLNMITLLSMTPRRDSRLSILGFVRSSEMEVPETLLKTELNAVWRRSEDPSRSSTLHDFSHLTNLDALCADDSSWLSRSVQLPTGTSIIQMQKESRSMSWLKVFTHRQLHTFVNLIHLYIDEDRESTSERDPEVTKWLSQSGISGQLLFPMLRILQLFVTDVNGADFIRRSSFPKLERVVLFLTSSEEMTMLDGDTSSIPAISLPFLVILSINLPYSWISLAALKAFTITHPIQLKRIRIHDNYNDRQQVSPVFVDSLRYTLSMLQPVVLDLRSGDSCSFLFLLEVLNLNSLQNFNIDGTGWGDGKSPLQDYINKNSVTPAIEALNLTHLVFEKIHVETCIRFLAKLSTSTNLKDLEADIVVGSEDIFVASCTSGQKLTDDEDVISDMSLDIFEQLFRERFGMDIEGSLVALLYESLGPNSGGRVKFPKLSGSQISLNFDASMYTQRDVLALGLKRCLHSILRSRSKSGGTRLVLQEAIQVEVEDPHTDGNRPFKFKFRLTRERVDTFETSL